MLERLEILLIESNPEIPKSSVGDFRVEVRPEDKKLLVPADVYQLLEAAGVKDAEAFVGYVGMVPTHFVKSLQWTESDLRQATIKLVARLVGYVPDYILFPESHNKSTFGLDPESKLS